jgi:hypothetical protein
VHPNALEISPNYSSTLYVIANLLGATTGITSPIVTSEFVSWVYISSLARAPH